MEGVLLLSALAMGLAGTPHCLAMCGAACTAVAAGCDRSHPQRGLLALHAGRVIGYSLAGALAAASVGALASLAAAVPVLRPLWTLVHLLALGLGLYLLWQGRQPAWLESLGRGAARAATGPDRAGAAAHAGSGVAAAHAGGGATTRAGGGSAAAGWQPMLGPARAAAAGGLWVAWPCGLLQSALLVAALANTALGGAAVMATFALASAAGLLAGPALWLRLAGGRPGGQRWGVRLAGAGLVAAAVFALGHGLWQTLWAWCFG